MMFKKVGGLSLISPKDAMKALVSKWVIQALLLSKSNLQIISRYCIKQLQPSTHGPWGPPPYGYSSHNSLQRGGSKVWHHNTQLWKVMPKTIAYIPPTISEDILQLNLWWRTEYQGL